MIFTIPSDTQASSFNSRETKANGLAQRSSINMRNAVLVADPAVGKVKALSWDIAIRIWSIICSQPMNAKKRGQILSVRRSKHGGSKKRGGK